MSAVDVAQSSATPDAAAPTASVGRDVRRRRQERHWTLDIAAARLGVSRRLLAQIEAGDGNPSLTTLLSIAAGFDISLVELLAATDKPTITVQRDNATAPTLWTGDDGSVARLLVGSDALELWEWTLAAGDARVAAAHRPQAREAMLVTTGAVTVTVGASDAVIVRRGQSASFPADEPHAYRNDTAKPARFVLAVHEPSGPVR